MSDTDPVSPSQDASPYATHLNILYPPLEVVDMPALIEACTDRWYNQTLCRVNDSVVRLGIMVKMVAADSRIPVARSEE